MATAMKADEALENTARRNCRDGDHDQATSVLIRGYGPELLGFLRERLKNATLADDAFASFCETLWKTMGRFEWRCSARVWCYTLARRAASRQAERSRRRAQRELILSRGSAISELIQQVRTTTALRARSRDEFQQLRDALSADDQTLLILRIDKGLSFREVAQVMDDGAAGDEERLERETARLRKRLQLIRKKLHTLARQRGLVPR